MTIDRRRFLQLTAATIVATLADSACAGDRSSNGIAQPDLSAMLGPDRVREIGTRYRTATPRENSADSLRAALSRSTGGSIDEQIHNDFEAGRTVLVDGWVLSITEARQAALFSLGAA
jgi:hypothetical protein